LISKQKKKVLWNPIIRIYLVSCLDLDLTALQGLKQLLDSYKKNEDSPSRNLSPTDPTKPPFTTSSIGKLLLLIALLLTTISIYRSLRANTPTVLKRQEGRIGTLYAGLKIREKMALDNTTVFFVRRLLMAGSVVFCSELWE